MCVTVAYTPVVLMLEGAYLKADRLNQVAGISYWRGWLYFNIYRVLLSCGLIAVSYIDPLPLLWGVLPGATVQVVQVVYLLLAVGLLAITALRHVPFSLQLGLGMMIDAVVFSILVYATGNTGGSFGLLLQVSLASHCLLAGNRWVWLYATMAAAAFLLQEIYFFLSYMTPMAGLSSLSRTGFFCLTFYMTAFVFKLLASYVRRTEEAAEHAVDHLSRLNSRIIETLQAGVIALNENNQVIFVNRPAMHLLNLKEDPQGRALSEVAPGLVRFWKGYRQTDEAVTSSTVIGDMEVQIIRLYGPSDLRQPEWLLIIEGSDAVRQRAADLKNASLARMTACIAHEIRNPLGAVSHAAQLLNEEQDLKAETRELVEIIDRHARRMNQVVTSISQLSRPTPHMDRVCLGDWLKKFSDEFVLMNSLAAKDCIIDPMQDEFYISVDTVQLHQIMWNLCENALRYSRKRPLIHFRCHSHDDNIPQVHIDVADTGAGIPSDRIENLFEPFYSTSGSMGLGLYVARELSVGNRGSLILLDNGPRGVVFRLSLPRL